ncbi:MAG TPA: hypothetical protein VJ805_06160 [Nitrospiraceae bacterium]|nr:hypothetical protein [Nitrospiraceae bacterium]
MNERQSPEDAGFIAQAKRLLDDDVRRLEAGFAGRLQRARCEALRSSTRPRWLGWRGGLAAASVAFVVLIFLVGRPDMAHQVQPTLEDLDVMTSTENADLSEDLEFYDWLADSAPAG